MKSAPVIAAVPPLNYIEMQVHSRASSYATQNQPQLPQRSKSTLYRRPVRSKFVVQAPVSRSILQEAEYSESEEFTHLQYTAITCEPEEFVGHGYKPRTLRYKRRIKVALVMTMYNEDENLFTKSMLNVQKNIAHMCHERNWGKDGWQVCS